MGRRAGGGRKIRRTEVLSAVAYLLEGATEEVNQREPENQGEHPALAQEPAPQQRRKVQHPGRAQAQRRPRGMTPSMLPALLYLPAASALAT